MAFWDIPVRKKRKIKYPPITKTKKRAEFLIRELYLGRAIRRGKKKLKRVI